MCSTVLALSKQNICAIQIKIVRGKNCWDINITVLNEPILVIGRRHVKTTFWNEWAPDFIQVYNPNRVVEIELNNNPRIQV